MQLRSAFDQQPLHSARSAADVPGQFGNHRAHGLRFPAATIDVPESDIPRIGAYLCWSNAYTRTLCQLGMTAAPSQSSPGLHQLLSGMSPPTRPSRTAAEPRQERRNGVTVLVSISDTLVHPGGGQHPRPIDRHYQDLRLAMQGVFHELGIAA